MAYSITIADRIRKALVGISDVKEKKMFGGLAFMVNEKMCLTVGPERIMCRIHPDIHEREVQKEGCSTVIMGGRVYKGYIYIKEESLVREEDFEHWVNLALQFNKQLTES